MRRAFAILGTFAAVSGILAPPRVAAADAAPTPIEPSPRDPSRPAYQLYAEYDLPALGIGLVFAGARMIRTQKAYCAPRCDPGDLNGLDRQTAGFWNPAWTNVSNVAIGVLLAAPAVYLPLDEGSLNALNDAVVLFESALLASSLSTIMTVAAGRPRPFLYGDKAPLEDRNSVDASMSFISSHTAISFAVSTSTWATYRRLHPDSSAHWAVLAVGDSAAALVGLARLLAGRHFPTDVLSGAIVGTSVGVLVPALHRTPVKVAPTATADGAGLTFFGAF
jgi:membrane-associated phospholipid phosphatase